MEKNTTVSKPDWLEGLTTKRLRGKAMSRKAVMVYSNDLTQLLWCNTSAARLFGGTGVVDFISQPVDVDHPFSSQLASAVKQLGSEPMFRGFRVVDEDRSRLLQCEIRFIKIQIDGEKIDKAVMVSCDNESLVALREHEFTQLVHDNLTELSPARAICDEFGLIMTASDKFVEIDILPKELEKACRKYDGKSIDVINANIGNGTQVSLRLFEIGKNPKRYLALVDTIGVNTTGVDTIGADTVEADTVELNEAKLPLDGTDDNDVQDNGRAKKFVEGLAAGVAGASGVLFGKRKGEMLDSAVGGDIDNDKTDNVDLEMSGDDARDEDAVIQSDHLDGEFVFSTDGDPVRFAWTTDTDQKFTSVSDELAQAVGPNAADVVGRKWRDVARVFGFDAKGDINELLKAQDTWSGKSILWPVQGTDLQVPVDLAALPSFSRGRVFEGFRGFGIVRLLDTIVDPDETGLALSGAQETPGNTQIGEPDLDAEENNNIVDLKSRRISSHDGENVSGDKRLSNGEHKAFDEIGRNLRKSGEAGLTPFQKQGIDSDDNGEKETLGNEEPQGEIASDKIVNDKTGVDTSLLEKLPVPVIVYRNGETLFANEAFLDLTGYSDFDEFLAAGGIDALFTTHDTDMIADENYTVVNDRDGGQMRVKALLKSVPWDSARALLISLRQPKHEKLPKNEKIVLDMMQVSELQNILNTATDGIAILSRDGVIQSINPSAEALFGRSDEDSRTKQVNELFATESHEIVKTYLNEIDDPSSQSKLNDGREVIGVEAKGGMIPLFITIGKIGNSDKFCLVLRDMTPWKKTREELINARRQAESASDQKTEFLARVSHEIRTPLNAIIGFSDVMIEERFGPVDNERYREYLRDINRSGIHVLDLINDLLDISKIEAGKMELSFEAVDLNKIVAETVALLQPQANGDRVLIRTSLSRAVPNVVADARSIRQIVLNLVSNAIKFTNANGQVIISTVYEGNGEVAMRVRDTGRGMTKEEVVVALKPFRQVNADNDTSGQGTGLGLPLTKALVEANKAYLDIESEPGEGTIVHIQFPTQRVLAD